jgi:hypothetical protein
MVKQYLFLLVMTMTALTAGCASLGIGEPTATPIPFNRYTAQDVFSAMSAANLQVQNSQRDLVVGRGAPSTFIDRYIFEIPRIAPSGGQVLIFETPEGLSEWQEYIGQLRSDNSTRRDVVYVFVKDNVMLQVNANLTTQEANAYRDALMGME